MNVLQQSTLYNKSQYHSISKDMNITVITGPSDNKGFSLDFKWKMLSHSEHFKNWISSDFFNQPGKYMSNISHSEYLKNWTITLPFIQEKEIHIPVVVPSVENTKKISQLKEKIRHIYNTHKEKNWDSYGAEPIKYLDQSLQFATELLFEPSTLIESIEVIPENDGCLCFEWFKSEKKMFTISVKENKLIYHYRIGDEEGCGETSFSGKKMLLDQIKRIY